MPSQNNHLVCTNQSTAFSLNTKRELYTHHTPNIILNVILLNWVDSTRTFITAKYVNVAFLKYYCGHSTPFLIKFSDLFPFILTDAIPLTAIKNSIDASTSNHVHEVSWVCEAMCVSWLDERVFLLSCFTERIVHIYLARNIGERGVETARNQNAPVVKTNSHGVALQVKVIRSEFLSP